jgi:hypothetical protein
MKKIHILLFLTLVFNTVYSQNDTLVAKDGTVLVGEIKDMDKGVLTMETSFSDDDFKIEWLQVKAIISSRSYRIVSSDGDRLFGTITVDSIGGKIVINDKKSGNKEYDLAQIVYLNHVEVGSVFDVLNLSLDLGYSYTKTSELHQLNGSFNADYLTNAWGVTSYANTVQSVQKDVTPISRTGAGLGLKLFFKHDIFAGTDIDIFSNNEQMLNLRTNYDLNIGKYFIHTNRIYFNSNIGIVYTTEDYMDTIPDRNNVEAKLGMEYNMFDVGDLNFLTSITVYPNITDAYRLRTVANIKLKYDLPRDFYIKFGLDYNYDTKPIEGVSPDDYVFTAGIGWEL